jgi:hypothetical protein
LELAAGLVSVTDGTCVSEGKKLDSVCKLVRLHDFRDQVEIAHTVSYRYLEPVSIENSREGSTLLLAPPRLGQKISIL